MGYGNVAPAPVRRISFCAASLGAPPARAAAAKAARVVMRTVVMSLLLEVGLPRSPEGADGLAGAGGVLVLVEIHAEADHGRLAEVDVQHRRDQRAARAGTEVDVEVGDVHAQRRLE